MNLRFELTSTLSHQIKTPLTTALIEVSHLENSEDFQNQHESLEIIKKKIQQICALSDEYLCLAKGGQLSVQKYKITEFVEEIEAYVKKKIFQASSKYS